jgi:hypothetical protein
VRGGRLGGRLLGCGGLGSATTATTLSTATLSTATALSAAAARKHESKEEYKSRNPECALLHHPP